MMDGLESKDLVITKMQLQDVAEAAALEARIFTVPWSENGFRSALDSKDTLYLTARENGKLVGYCGFWQSFDEADITNVAVDESCRKRGVGYRMLHELMRLGRERGVLRYTLEVRVGNTAAIHLYEKLGFASAGVRKNFYEKPREDALIMWTEP